MDIEMLKELSEYTSNLCFIALSKLTDKNARENVVAYGEGVKKLIDEAIARQSEEEVVACPNCNGSGVYQEYDEYDRYHAYACYQCNGSGEVLHQSIINEEGYLPLQAEQEYNKLFEDKCIKTGLNLVDIFYPSGDDAVQVVQTTARQSVTSKAVAEAIEWIEEILSNGNMWQDGDFGIPVKTSRKLEDIKQTILVALQAYRPKGE